MGSDFGSGSCQSVRLGPPDLTTTSCKHFSSSAILSKQGIETQIVQPSTFFGTMAKADQALSLFTKRELEDYETLKTKQEKLSSCCKELRKLSRRIIGGSKGTSADTLEAYETLKKELKTDITKLKKVVKRAYRKAYYKIRKNETKTKN